MILFVPCKVPSHYAPRVPLLQSFAAASARCAAARNPRRVSVPACTAIPVDSLSLSHASHVLFFCVLSYIIFIIMCFVIVFLIVSFSRISSLFACVDNVFFFFAFSKLFSLHNKTVLFLHFTNRPQPNCWAVVCYWGHANLWHGEDFSVNSDVFVYKLTNLLRGLFTLEVLLWLRECANSHSDSTVVEIALEKLFIWPLDYLYLIILIKVGYKQIWYFNYQE